MDIQLDSKVQKLFRNTKKEAFEIIHEKIPNKIIELTSNEKMYPNYKSSQKDLHWKEEVEKYLKQTETKQKDNQKKRKKESLIEEDQQCNSEVLSAYQILKKEALDMTEMLGIVKQYIQLNIPKISDGNNFGVGVQEEVLSEISRVEKNGLFLFETVTKYFLTRAKLLCKVKKHPEIEDYKRSLYELDQDQIFNLQITYRDMAQDYAVLYDLIMKNLEKLKNPRSEAHLPTMF
ncbi:hypothetical protein M0811_00199 [Anaeramoeba ignava]|uniref:Proteasome activator PA28 C-terminal domain-containing protein n=1 Tax=Anaeramoeba ignava TaxID=1746090 RepID=A0A9Q0LNM7_ANAIG|nr:hypothetical protein M0811_00199 [Anaeramoeba ignava]